MPITDAARVASAIRSCEVFREAVKLAAWLGADGPALTAPWIEKRRAYPFGIGSGIIRASGWTTVAGADVAGLSDEERLTRWRAGVRTACAAETPWGADDGVLLLVLAVLEVLAEKTGARAADRDFWTAVDETVRGAAAWYGLPAANPIRARRQYDTPRWRGGGSPGLIELLKYFGMVSGDLRRPRLTDLGRLARDLLAGDLPVAADPELPAADLLELVAPLSCGETDDLDTMNRITAAWIRARDRADARREILAAASAMPASARLAAARIARRLGHPEPDPDDRLGLVEYLAAYLERGDVDEVLTTVWGALPAETVEDGLGLVAATGHPDADAIVSAVREFIASGAPRGIDRVLRLRVTLLDAVEETWREVVIPATATLLEVHHTAMILFGRADGSPVMDESPFWFTAGDQRYGDTYGGRRALDAVQIRISPALSRSERVGYVHIPDAYWHHEITLEETLPRDPDERYPVCVAFAGGNPSRYPGLWRQTEPFDLGETSRRLAEYRDELSGVRAGLGESDHW